MTDIPSLKGQVPPEEWQTRIDLAAAYRLVAMHAEQILAGAKQMKEQVTHGLGGQLVWPGLLRKLDRQMPGYDH